MAGEIQAQATAGKTLYALVRNSVGQVWQTTTSTFVAYVTANLANYKIALTEQGTASGYYAGTFPAAVAGVYGIVVKQQAGGSPAESDVTVGLGEIQWSGTSIRTQADVVAVNHVPVDGVGTALDPWGPV